MLYELFHKSYQPSNRMFGLSTKVGGGKENVESEEWAGRISHLERALGRRVDFATEEIRAEIQDLEKRLRPGAN